MSTVNLHCCKVPWQKAKQERQAVRPTCPSWARHQPCRYLRPPSPPESHCCTHQRCCGTGQEHQCSTHARSIRDCGPLVRHLEQCLKGQQPALQAPNVQGQNHRSTATTQIPEHTRVTLLQGVLAKGQTAAPGSAAHLSMLLLLPVTLQVPPYPPPNPHCCTHQHCCGPGQEHLCLTHASSARQCGPSVHAAAVASDAAGPLMAGGSTSLSKTASLPAQADAAEP
jgi:hypothetical protein